MSSSRSNFLTGGSATWLYGPTALTNPLGPPTWLAPLSNSSRMIVSSSWPLAARGSTHRTSCCSVWSSIAAQADCSRVVTACCGAGFDARARPARRSSACGWSIRNCRSRRSRLHRTAPPAVWFLRRRAGVRRLPGGGLGNSGADLAGKAVCGHTSIPRKLSRAMLSSRGASNVHLGDKPGSNQMNNIPRLGLRTHLFTDFGTDLGTDRSHCAPPARQAVDTGPPQPTTIQQAHAGFFAGSSAKTTSPSTPGTCRCR